MAETVFISGADKGLGFSLAGRFLSGGFHVFAGAYTPPHQNLWCGGKPSSDFSLLQKKFCGKLTIVPLDVADMDSVRKAARKVAEQTTSLDILINNAAIHTENKTAPLEEIDLTDSCYQDTFNVNTYGALRMTQQFLPLLEKGSRKLIANISSEAGSIADCSRSRDFAYCMSKAALNMQSKLLQNYLGPRGFKILAVHPGWMRTDMTKLEGKFHPDESAENIFKLLMGNWTPKEVIYLDHKGNALRW